MKLRAWQRAEIDATLFRLRLRHRDPETGDIDEGPKSALQREWLEWVESRDYAVDYALVASTWKRDNIERLHLKLKDKEQPEEPDRLVYEGQCILPLTLDGSVTTIAEDATRRHFQEHRAMYQQKLEEHVSRGERYIRALQAEMWRFQTENERWSEVQDRPYHG